MSYLLTDHLGSVVAITDSNGTLTSQQRYLPFGQVRTDLNGPRITQTDFGYTGQRTLDMGLMDYKARAYDPLLMRFIQPDTIVPSIGSQAFNRYSYVLNNPIRYNDPSGHKVCMDDGYCGKASDYGYQKLIYTSALKDRFKWQVGSGFSLGELKIIYQAGDDISNAVGGDEYVIKLFGSVAFEKKKMKDGGQGDAHHVWLNSDPSKWNKWSVVHELGHSLDGEYKWQLSKGLEEFTGGYTLSGPISLGGPACLDETARGCNLALYFYGGVPPKGSDWNFNRKEDFAEAFAAYIYPAWAKQQIEDNFKADPGHLAIFDYENYTTTPRGMYMSSLMYLLTH